MNMRKLLVLMLALVMAINVFAISAHAAYGTKENHEPYDYQQLVYEVIDAAVEADKEAQKNYSNTYQFLLECGVIDLAVEAIDEAIATLNDVSLDIFNLSDELEELCYDERDAMVSTLNEIKLALVNNTADDISGLCKVIEGLENDLYTHVSNISAIIAENVKGYLPFIFDYLETSKEVQAIVSAGVGVWEFVLNYQTTPQYQMLINGLYDLDREIRGTISKVRDALENITKLELVLSKNSTYVALGNSTYAYELAQKLNLAGKCWQYDLDNYSYYALSNADLITVQLDMVASSEVVYSQISAVLAGAIRNNGDLMNFYNHNQSFVDEFLAQYNLDLNAEVEELAWDDYLDEQEIATLNEFMSAFREILVAACVPEIMFVDIGALLTEYLDMQGVSIVIEPLQLPLIDLVMTSLESSIYSYFKFASEYISLLNDIENIAPNAKVIVTGMTNPVANVDLSALGIDLEGLQMSADVLVEYINAFAFATTLDYENVIFVNSQDADVIYDSLDVVCVHSYSGCEDTDCDLCHEIRVAPGHHVLYKWYNYDHTCTTDGTYTAKCSNCSTYYTIDAPGTALGHSIYSYYNNDATCTTDGTNTYYCTRCDLSYRVTALGTAHHVWIKVDIQDTYIKICDRCDEIEGLDLGSDFESFAKSYAEVYQQALASGYIDNAINSVDVAIDVILGIDFSSFNLPFNSRMLLERERLNVVSTLNEIKEILADDSSDSVMGLVVSLLALEDDLNTHFNAILDIITDEDIAITVDNYFRLSEEFSDEIMAVVTIINDLTTVEYTLTPDSSFVSLGNSSYADELAEKLHLGDKYLKFDMDDDYLDALSKADLISINLDNGKYAQFIYRQFVGAFMETIRSHSDLMAWYNHSMIGEEIKNIMGSLGLDINESPKELDWSKYLNEDEIAILKNVLTSFRGELVKNGAPEVIYYDVNPIINDLIRDEFPGVSVNLSPLEIPMADILMLCIESSIYSYVEFSSDLNNLFDTVSTVAPDAKVIVTSIDNPYKDIALLVAGMISEEAVAYVEASDYLVACFNAHVFASTLGYDNIIFVNSNNADEIFDAIEFSCAHVYSGCVDTECDLCHEVRVAPGHSFTYYTSNGDATCTENGTMTSTCDNCDVTNTVTELGSARGHIYSNYYYNNDATCVADGTKTATCDRCHEATDTVTALGTTLGHNYGDYTYNNDATCVEDGTQSATCDRCGEIDTQVAEDTALGHTWIAATCTEAKTCETCGETEGEALGHDWKAATCIESKTCKRCSEIDGVALGHSFTNYVYNEDATCVADGTKTATCDRCNVTETKTVSGTAFGHTWNDATCTEAKICSVCEAIGGAALGHSFTNYVYNEDATCVANGTKTATCDRCDVTDTKAAADTALGHAWVDATCTEAKICSVCDAIGGAALGHSFTNYVYNEDATCVANGTKTATCDRCTVTDTKVAANTAPGHAWIDATCTEAKVCSVCDATIGVALGHSFTNYVSNGDATCTANGTKTAKCDRCDLTDTKVDANTALGHAWADATCTTPKMCANCELTEGEALGHNWKDATCTEAKVCLTCNESDGVIPGHTWKDATCTEAKVCVVCEETKGVALGHSWSGVTCTEPQSCKNCGMIQGLPAGHKYGAWEVVTEATKKAEGLKKQVCSVCGDTIEEVIPKREGMSTGTIVVIAIVAILVGVGSGIGAYLFLKNKKEEADFDGEPTEAEEEIEYIEEPEEEPAMETEAESEMGYETEAIAEENIEEDI